MYYVSSVNPAWDSIEFYSDIEEAEKKALAEAKRFALRGDDNRTVLIYKVEQTFQANVPDTVVEIKEVDLQTLIDTSKEARDPLYTACNIAVD